MGRRASLSYKAGWSFPYNQNRGVYLIRSSNLDDCIVLIVYQNNSDYSIVVKLRSRKEMPVIHALQLRINWPARCVSKMVRRVIVVQRNV